MRLLITGASGQLGGYLLHEVGAFGATVTAWSNSHSSEVAGIPLHRVDLCNHEVVAAAFRHARPEVVLHAAAWARVADCQRDPAQAQRVNTEGSALLARLAAEAGARLLLVSTDLVFDGEQAPYRETATPTPVSIYGRTKAAAEAAVLAHPRTAAARVSLLFGPTRTGRPGFFDEQVAALRAGRSVTLFRDEWRTPLDLATAARALLTLALSEQSGVFHLGGPERLSRLEMGQRLADFLGITHPILTAVDRSQAPAPEPRPRDVSLDSSRWHAHFPQHPWPTWEEALRQLLPA
jgi:dTDP-4-dehydrorhamnose reductase